MRLAVFVALALLAGAADARAATLAWALDDPDPALDTQVQAAVASALGAEWSIDPRRVPSPTRYVVRRAAHRRTPDDLDRLFVVAERLRSIRGIAAAGLLVSAVSQRERVVIYDGTFVANFEPGASRAEMERWAPARFPQLTLDVAGRTARHRGRVLPGSIAAIPAPSGALRSVEPVFRFFPPHRRSLVAADYGGFHRLPLGRNVLGLIFRSTATQQQVTDVVDAVLTANGDPGRSDNRIRLFDFAGGEAAMDAAIETIRNDPDLSGPLRIYGPTLAEDLRPGVGSALNAPLPVPGIVAPRLIVRFTPGSRFIAESQLFDDPLGDEDLTFERALPYIEGTYVYSMSYPTYRIFDIAEQLLEADPPLATLAIPDIWRENLSATTTDSCPLDDPNGDYAYLDLIDACGAWELLGDVEDDGPVIGLIDRGVNPTYGSRLRIKGMAAFGSDPVTSCIPPNNCQFADGWGELHGSAMALVAAAVHAEDHYKGVAPNASLISADRGIVDSTNLDQMTDLHFADGLWWISGGSPGGSFPARSDPAPAPADVINLSFWRDGHDTDCDPATWDCVGACAAAQPTCSVIEGVLERLYSPLVDDPVRDSGVLVNVAMSAYEGNHLAEADATLTVGSVELDGKPYSGSQPFNAVGEELDLVAPAGPDIGIALPPNLNGGASSGATAIVSGVVAMMFTVNPSLTPAQAKCLLRETAIESPDAATIAGWTTVSDPPYNGTFADLCAWNAAGTHSPCFGYGQVDAARAVSAAASCKLSIDERDIELYFSDRALFEDGRGVLDVRPLDPLPRVRSDLILDEVPYRLSNTSDACPCTPHGVPTSEIITLAVAAPRDEEGFPQPFDDKVLKLLRCLRDQSCACTIPDRCIIRPLFNPTRDLDGVTFHACFDDRCWPAGDLERSWERGTTRLVSLPTDPKIVELWEELGRPPTLEVREHGEPVSLEPRRTRSRGGRRRGRGSR